MGYLIGMHLTVSRKTTKKTPRDVMMVPSSSQALMHTKEQVGSVALSLSESESRTQVAVFTTG